MSHLDIYIPYEDKNNFITPNQLEHIEKERIRKEILLQNMILNYITRTHGAEEEIPTGWPLEGPSPQEREEYYQLDTRNKQRKNIPIKITEKEREINEKDVEEASGVGKKKKRKTRKVKKRKAGMIGHLLSRQLTGKTTPSMIEDFLALKQKEERKLKQKQDRNNIALKQIEYYKKITDDANTNDLNDINLALVYLSNSLKKDLLLNKDKEDMEDFKLKLIKKRNELESRSSDRTGRRDITRSRSRSRSRSRGKTVKRRKTRNGRK